MQLRIFETTDKQHIGHTFEYDPESPISSLYFEDNDFVEIMSVKSSGDYYQFFSPNYLIGALVVG
jgi:hypothetical protein